MTSFCEMVPPRRGGATLLQKKAREMNFSLFIFIFFIGCSGDKEGHAADPDGHETCQAAGKGTDQCQGKVRSFLFLTGIPNLTCFFLCSQAILSGQVICQHSMRLGKLCAICGMEVEE